MTLIDGLLLLAAIVFFGALLVAVMGRVGDPKIKTDLDERDWPGGKR